MAKMGETPIYLNMPTFTTVQTTIARKVNIRKQGQENRRISLILTIPYLKKAPLLIFKAIKRKGY